MEYHFYDKIYKKDGSIDNFHYCVNNPDIVLDMQNELRAKGEDVRFIKSEQWESEKTNRIEDEFCWPMKIGICDDIEPGDAMGEQVGYLEYYVLKAPTIKNE